MAYTEIKKQNNEKYYYRVLSVRKGKNIEKKRIYLGANLTEEELTKKIKEAEKEGCKEIVLTGVNICQYRSKLLYFALKVCACI